MHWLYGCMPLAEASHIGDGVSIESQMDVQGTVALLTWLTFFAAAIILYKIAWKPILAALDHREHTIKRSLEQAAAASAKAEQTMAQQQQLLGQAQAQAQAIVAEARQEAEKLAATLRQKTEQEIRQLLENARKDIAAARAGAVAHLRRESAGLALELAERLLKTKLDETADRALVEKLAEEYHP